MKKMQIPPIYGPLALPFMLLFKWEDWIPGAGMGARIASILIHILLIIFSPVLALFLCCFIFAITFPDLTAKWEDWRRRRRARKATSRWRKELSAFCSQHCPGVLCPKHGTFCFQEHASEKARVRGNGDDVERAFPRFMRLPLVARERIYEMAIETTSRNQRPDDFLPSWSAVSENHALLFVSRQVRKEAMPCFYTASRFRVRVFDNEAFTMERNPLAASDSPPPYDPICSKATCYRSLPGLSAEQIQEANDHGPRVSPWIHTLPDTKFEQICHLRLEFHWQVSWADHWPLAVFDIDYRPGDDYYDVTKVPPWNIPWWCMEAWRAMEMEWQYKWLDKVLERINEVLEDVKHSKGGELRPEDLERLAYIQAQVPAWEGRGHYFGAGREPKPQY